MVGKKKIRRKKKGTALKEGRNNRNTVEKKIEEEENGLSDESKCNNEVNVGCFNEEQEMNFSSTIDCYDKDASSDENLELAIALSLSLAEDESAKRNAVMKNISDFSSAVDSVNLSSCSSSAVDSVNLSSCSSSAVDSVNLSSCSSSVSCTTSLSSVFSTSSSHELSTLDHVFNDLIVIPLSDELDVKDSASEFGDLHFKSSQQISSICCSEKNDDNFVKDNTQIKTIDGQFQQRTVESSSKIYDESQLSVASYENNLTNCDFLDRSSSAIASSSFPYSSTSCSSAISSSNFSSCSSAISASNSSSCSSSISSFLSSEEAKFNNCRKSERLKKLFLEKEKKKIVSSRNCLDNKGKIEEDKKLFYKEKGKILRTEEEFEDESEKDRGDYSIDEDDNDDEFLISNSEEGSEEADTYSSEEDEFTVNKRNKRIRKKRKSDDGIFFSSVRPKRKSNKKIENKHRERSKSDSVATDENREVKKQKVGKVRTQEHGKIKTKLNLVLEAAREYLWNQLSESADGGGGVSTSLAEESSGTFSSETVKKNINRVITFFRLKEMLQKCHMDVNESDISDMIHVYTLNKNSNEMHYHDFLRAFADAKLRVEKNGRVW